MALARINPQDNNIKLQISQDEESGFVVKCEEYPYVIGVAETKEEAIEIFYEHLAAWQKHEKEGRIAKPNKGGRPKKNNVGISLNISVEAKMYLDYYCIQNDIKQGELINKLIIDFRDKQK